MHIEVPSQKKTHVAVYIRVSSEEQVKYGDSLRDQKETCLDYIERHKNLELQGIYIDEGISGQKLAREGFEQLMESVSSGYIDLIIFTKLDRWFRSLRHYLNTQAVLEANRVSWLAVDQPYFDTSTPHGRAFVAQSMTWAELEAQNDGIRIRDVFDNKVKYGEVISGKVPIGYRIEDKHLVFTEEAPAILDIFHYFHREQSLKKTLSYMRQEYGIEMSMTNLKVSVLQNVKYTGKFRENQNFCPRLVPESLFQDIQRVFESNINIKSNQKYDYIFSGLLVCKECGGRMSGRHIHVSSKQKYRYRYPAYECGKYRKHCCENGGSVRETKVEQYLLTQVCDAMDCCRVTYDIKKASGADVEARRSTIRKKADRLKTLFLNGLISLDEYRADREQYDRQLAALRDIGTSAAKQTLRGPFLDEGFEAFYNTLDNIEKREFWRSIIKEVRVSKSQNRLREFEAVFL